MKQTDEDLVDNDDILWKHISSISSRDAEFHHLYAKSVSTHSRKVKLDLMKHMHHMMYVDEIFSNFLGKPAHKLHECRLHDAQSGLCID